MKLFEAFNMVLVLAESSRRRLVKAEKTELAAQAEEAITMVRDFAKGYLPGRINK